MLTVILQASQLRRLVVGEEHPTVITFDMALYEKAVQLLDSRDNLKRTALPRLSEFHTMMSAGLMTLSEEGDLTQEGKNALANFVCVVYCPKGIHIRGIPDLRWHLFC